MKYQHILIISTCVLFLLVAIALMYKKEENFMEDINTQPLRAVYNPIIQDCGDCASPTGYGLNKEHNNDIGICSFIQKFEPNIKFSNENACDVPSRQICEVLYSDHQQYFENMWSGLGECEIYQKEQCKLCPIKTTS